MQYIDWGHSVTAHVLDHPPATAHNGCHFATQAPHYRTMHLLTFARRVKRFDQCFAFTPTKWSCSSSCLPLAPVPVRVDKQEIILQSNSAKIDSRPSCHTELQQAHNGCHSAITAMDDPGPHDPTQWVAPTQLVAWLPRGLDLYLCCCSCYRTCHSSGCSCKCTACWLMLLPGSLLTAPAAVAGRPAATTQAAAP